MRDRRWRRLVDRGTAQPRVGWVRRAIVWVRTHILGIVIGAAAVAVTGWFSGFFGAILAVVPSGPEAFCDLRERIEYHWPFAAPLATSDRFTILIATIDRDDADHTYTRAVERAFFKKDGIDRIETCRVLRLSGVGRDAEITAVATARKWLEQRHADLLIGGEMLKKDDAVSLWFIDKDPAHDWRPSTYSLDANLLKKDFAEAASTQLLGVALSAIRPATEENGKYLVGILKPVAERLQHLLEDASLGFTGIPIARLQHALGLALLVIGEQAGDNNALADSVKAFRAALTEFTRDRVPLDWAAAQNNLGSALAQLGERETPARLEEAVAAFLAALEVSTRDRVPLDWAGTQNNLGLALARLGERESGTAHLEQAVAAFRASLAERTRERVPLDWAATQNNLGLALARLGERESGTAHLEQAVAAFRAALAERTRERVPLDWAATEDNLGLALGSLGERESGTARLEEAVAAHRAALEERRRDRVPLDWGVTQMNLGTALLRLGERESGTARLEEAIAADRAALEVSTRDRVPLDWAATQNNLGLALTRLGERESGTAHLEQAVAAFRAALAEQTRERVPLDWAGSREIRVSPSCCSRTGSAMQVKRSRPSSRSRWPS